MVSEQDIDDIDWTTEGWDSLSHEDRMAVVQLERIAHEAMRERERFRDLYRQHSGHARELQAALVRARDERDAERERSRKLVEALRAEIAGIAEYERVATEMPGEAAASALATVREDLADILAGCDGGEP